jgi:uncharacterized OB-fold protein
MPSPRYWREVPSRYRLEATRCADCGRVSYPPRRICPACRSDETHRLELSHEGRVVTCTVVHVPPGDFLMEAPYALAIIETPEGARMMVQVVDTDPAAVEPGMAVSLEFRLIRKEGRGGILCYGHKAVPAYPSGEEPASQEEERHEEVQHA